MFHNTPPENPTEHALEGHKKSIETGQVLKVVDMVKNNKLVHHIRQLLGPELKGNFDHITDNYGPLLSKENIGPINLGGDSLQEQWERIVENIRTPLTEDGNEYTIVRHQGETTLYGANFNKIREDIALLSQLQTTFPQYTHAFSIADQALNEYIHDDPNISVAEFELAHHNGYTDSAIRHMGKLIIFPLAVTAALGTGIAAVIGKKSFTAPLIYAAVAGMCSSSVRSMIFDKQHQHVLAEVDGSLNQREFRAMLGDYRVNANWSPFVESIMDRSSEETTEMINMLHKNGNSAHIISPEIIDTYVKQAIPNDTKSQDNLAALIYSGKFPHFVRTLQSVKSDEAREMVQAYFKHGAVDFEVAAQMEANKLNQQQPQQ